MNPGARLAGADPGAVWADNTLLQSVGDDLRSRWADTVALRSRTEGIDLAGAGDDDDPLSIVAGLPERLRTDLELLDGIQEAVAAAWQGVSAVCDRLARVVGDAVADLTAEFDDDEAVGVERDDPAVGSARAGIARIDHELGRLDGELVLIGGH